MGDMAEQYCRDLNRCVVGLRRRMDGEASLGVLARSSTLGCGALDLLASVFLGSAPVMTHDSFSDLVLFAVCSYLVCTNLRPCQQRAGIGIACLWIGLAAGLGVLKFSDFSPINQLAAGPHRIVAAIAAVGAFPILAFSLTYPSSPIASRLNGAWWFTFIVGGLGIAIWLVGAKFWAQVTPALCSIPITIAVLQGRDGKGFWIGLFAITALFASFGVALFMGPTSKLLGVFSGTQLLHYLLSMALFLICVPVSSRSPRTK